MEKKLIVSNLKNNEVLKTIFKYLFNNYNRK